LRRTEKALNRIFGDGFDVRPPMPVALDSADTGAATGAPDGLIAVSDLLPRSAAAP
jgi:hypothetical protein